MGDKQAHRSAASSVRADATTDSTGERAVGQRVSDELTDDEALAVLREASRFGDDEDPESGLDLLRALGEATRQLHRHTRWRFDLEEARLLLLTRDLASARSRLEQLEAEGRQHEDPVLLGGVGLLTGLAHLLENDPAQAASAWEQARSLFVSEQLHEIVAEIDTELARLRGSARIDRTRFQTGIDRAGRSANPVDRSHSPDFRSVVWFGREFQFTATQAACVEILWGAWEKGSPDVGQERILEDVGSRALRLLDVFRRSAAWGTMIVRGATRGTYRLQTPGNPTGEP